jgi:hypothetical protein
MKYEIRDIYTEIQSGRVAGRRLDRPQEFAKVHPRPNPGTDLKRT